MRSHTPHYGKPAAVLMLPCPASPVAAASAVETGAASAGGRVFVYLFVCDLLKHAVSAVSGGRSKWHAERLALV